MVSRYSEKDTVSRYSEKDFICLPKHVMVDEAKCAHDKAYGRAVEVLRRAVSCDNEGKNLHLDEALFSSCSSYRNAVTVVVYSRDENKKEESVVSENKEKSVVGTSSLKPVRSYLDVALGEDAAAKKRKDSGVNDAAKKKKKNSGKKNSVLNKSNNDDNQNQFSRNHVFSSTDYHNGEESVVGTRDVVLSKYEISWTDEELELQGLMSGFDVKVENIATADCWSGNCDDDVGSPVLCCQKIDSKEKSGLWRISESSVGDLYINSRSFLKDMINRELAKEERCLYN